MFNYLRPPHLPQTHVGGRFFREFYSNISPTLLSQMYPQEWPKKLAANEKGLWQVGHLKLNCPNVRRCNLLLFNYLKKFSWFPSAETNVQKNSQSWDLFRQPHLPQTHVGGRFFREFYSNISPTLLSQMYPHKWPKNLPPTKRACGQVGHLKHLCPNVRQYKLLILSYLPMFKRFPSAETKVQ